MIHKKIDYELTVKKFLKNAWAFFDNRMGNAPNMWEYDGAQKAAERINTILHAYPEFFRDIHSRDAMFNMFNKWAFARLGGPDNGIRTAFINAMWAAAKMQKKPSKENRTKFLWMLKKWNHTTSTNMFKDLYYPFLSPATFAVKEKSSHAR